MEHENFTIEIEGRDASDLYDALVSLEVELDEDLAALFKLQISLLQEQGGTWRNLDDQRMMIWKKVKVSAGFASGVDPLIEGYITHVRPRFDPDPSQCTLEIWGMDMSVVMDREEMLKDWPNKKDSDIASEIFNTYGFTPQVEDTGIIHDEAVSTIMQRETDMQLLKRLARRNGYECYVEGNTGYFRSPRLSDAPQPVLAAHFGDETNLNLLSLEVNALRAASAAMAQVDRASKEVLDASAETSQRTALGARDAAALLPAGVNAARIHVGMNAATGNPEMTALCQGLYDEYAWFVSGEGEAAGNKYGHVLKPRKTVTIKGIGETYSGVYYVSHVTHAFTAEGYVQRFRVKRNALMPTGSENFSASGGGGGLV